MSIQKALAFIQEVRSSGTWESRVRALAHEADLERLVEIGREMGFAFTVDELRAAFTHDWAMRWFRVTAQTGQESVTNGKENVPPEQ